MKTRLGVSAVLLGWLLSAPGWTADPPMRPKHLKAHVTCFDCHREETPSQAAVAEDTCMACHGDLPAMAAYTKGLPVNPHRLAKAGHPGPFACTECHHQHRPPVVKCLECHPDFKLTPK